MPWVPQQGWAYSGGDYTVAIGGNGYRGVFIGTEKADFNRLFEMLVGGRYSGDLLCKEQLAEGTPPSKKGSGN